MLFIWKDRNQIASVVQVDVVVVVKVKKELGAMDNSIHVTNVLESKVFVRDGSYELFNLARRSFRPVFLSLDR